MRGGRVLLVDDEETIRRTLARALELTGHQVTLADHGGTAITIIDEGPPFDVVITDLTLDGPGGIEVLRGAKERDPETGVIVITGYSAESSALDALRFGADDYLTKPFDYAELLLRVARCLERRELARKVRVYEGILGVCPACGRVSEGPNAGFSVEDLAARRCAEARAACGACTGTKRGGS